MIPAGVMTGLAVGGSCAIGVYFELPDESPFVQRMYKNKHTAAIWSTVVSLTVGYYCGPVAGVISEMINYPISLLKVRKINKFLKKDYDISHKKLADASTISYSQSSIQGIFA